MSRQKWIPELEPLAGRAVKYACFPAAAALVALCVVGFVTGWFDSPTPPRWYEVGFQSVAILFALGAMFVLGVSMANDTLIRSFISKGVAASREADKRAQEGK